MAAIDNARKFLVLEDAAADRLRFRLLFEKVNRDNANPKKISSEFAWRLGLHGQGSVMAWILEESGIIGSATVTLGEQQGPGDQLTKVLPSILPKLCQYDVLLLDLAWTVIAERAVMPLLVESIEVQRGKRTELEKNVEGFALIAGLNEARSRGDRPLPEVWVTSAYVPRREIGFPLLLTTDYGVPADRVFHKWSDERLFVKALHDVS
jgi:hypothetical protein